MFWVIFGLGFCVGVWLNFNFLFVFVCVCHPQFSHLSLSMSRVQSLFVCLLSLVTSWFYLERLHFPSCVYLFLLSLLSLIPWLFSAVFWFPSVSISLITSISWILGFLYFLHVSAKKYCYMKLKSFLFIFYFIFMIVLNCLYIILCIS